MVLILIQRSRSTDISHSFSGNLCVVAILGDLSYEATKQSFQFHQEIQLAKSSTVPWESNY